MLITHTILCKEIESCFWVGIAMKPEIIYHLKAIQLFGYQVLEALKLNLGGKLNKMGYGETKIRKSFEQVDSDAKVVPYHLR